MVLAAMFSARQSSALGMVVNDRITKSASLAETPRSINPTNCASPNLYKFCMDALNFETLSLAMSGLVFGLSTLDPVTIDDVTFVDTSFPGFTGLMNGLIAGAEALVAA